MIVVPLIERKRDGDVLLRDEWFDLVGAYARGDVPDYQMAALLMAVLCMLFGANAVAVKISLTGLGVFTTAGLRFAVASLAGRMFRDICAEPEIGNHSRRDNNVCPV